MFGTIKFSQLTDLGEYVILFFIGTLLLAFWIIPVVISSLTPLRYKEIIFELRKALIVSAATTLSVVALPYIHDVTSKLIKNAHREQPDTNNIINTSLTISYPFGQLGNFFLSIFILFAALYFNQPLSESHQALLPLTTYLSSIGSPSTAVNAVAFLVNWLHLPPETTNLYISIMPLTRYGQVLASVMGFAFMTILMNL